MLSVVIPVLNAAQSLPEAIGSVANGADEIVVADGGSSDGSIAAAERLGARVVQAPRGRGRQLDAGAAAASGDWLLFLHADTRLGDGWAAAAEAFMQEGPRATAAYFRLAFDEDAPVARRTARIAAWRARRLGLPYGDQGFLIARSTFAVLGGFRGLPLMEDVDLARRVGRKRLTALPAEAVTSAVRYRRSGWTARSLRNLFCLALYFAGVAPERIKRIYG